MKEKLLKYRWIFQLAISIILVTYIYNKVDFKSFLASFKLLPWYILLIVPVIGILQVYITTIMQLRLFSVYSLKISTSRLFRENFVAAFYGMAVPGLIGNDLYLVNLFGGKINNYFNALTGVFFLRFLGLMVFIVSISMSFLLLDKTKYQFINSFDLEISPVIIFVLIGFVILSIIGLLIFRKNIVTVFKKLREKLAPLINLIKKEKYWTLSILLQVVLYYIVAIGGRAWLAKISGIDLSFLELSALIMIVNLLIMLPVSYSGIGVREGGYIGLLVILNIDKSKALIFSVMDFSITIFVFTVGAIISFIVAIARRKGTTG